MLETPTALIVDYIDEHKHEFGVEPICATLSAAGTQIAPSTYYAAKTRPPSVRSLRDEQVLVEIRRVHEANYGVYGARKVHAQLRREGLQVARCTVERLMRAAGLRGISRAKGPKTTVPGRGPDPRPDLVQRDFTAAAPNQLWVADITYCRTFAGWVYAAFIIDVFSRRVLGWQLSKSLRTDLSRWSAQDLAAVAYTLNNRPRRVLDWKTPAEVFAEQLSSLTTNGVATTG